ncbi:Glycosyltransferase involved in cell wall bisynthesis [Flavobacterium succinicans]|uniref:Glycosyltransferase involved in cell wall bisynthesis n=1 Tax=Flavobacterium succinicans TaxID=29536 RepID=A0A1I4UGH7_9FLAO|nr:glycosyltransferase [Flavobacterium succinicans]SFM87823.1 Glycosyltransferase involved in cell wall bisynthesis [Flavobacterium succinicans]
MRILYFYPENPLSYTQGNNARALSLLQYFKNRKIYLDFVGEASKEFEEDAINELKRENLIKNGYLLKKEKKSSNIIKYYLNYSFPKKFNSKLKDFDRTKFGYKEQFSKIVRDNDYDFIIVSYVYWSPLLDAVTKGCNTKWIIDTHDFLTSQFQDHKKFALDRYFKKEISVMKKFDEVWVISNEEKYLFSQFITKQVSLITHSLPNAIETSSKTEKTIDVLYVASENFHNIKSAKWFFKEVYPLLSSDLKITIVGKVGNHISNFENVEKLIFVKELEDVYSKAKITVCPMLSGTGVKIKVIESLSHGIPVVCTERGVDGLLNKTNNGCLTTNDPLLFSKHINTLLNDNEFYKKNHLEAKRFFENHFDVKKTYKVLDAIFAKN